MIPLKIEEERESPLKKIALVALFRWIPQNIFGIPHLKKRTYLVAMKDDFSRAILAAKIFPSDTTWANMCIIREAIEKYGLFEAIYTDNDSKFKFIRSGFSMHFEYRVDLERIQTEIHRSLLELEIAFLHHYPKNPEAKGYTSHCTSLIRFDSSLINSLLLPSFFFLCILVMSSLPGHS